MPVNNIIPGEDLEYDFIVANNKDGIRSEINIGYTISIITFKILPVKIELYNDSIDKPILECNETNFDRNEENKLVCTTEEYSLDYSNDNTNKYKVKISFEEYNEENEIWTEDYSELIDFVDIKINSWQIVE